MGDWVPNGIDQLLQMLTDLGIMSNSIKELGFKDYWDFEAHIALYVSLYQEIPYKAESAWEIRDVSGIYSVYIDEYVDYYYDKIEGDRSDLAAAILLDRHLRLHQQVLTPKLSGQRCSNQNPSSFVIDSS